MQSSRESRREPAIKRINAKNDFKIHLFVYVAVNAMLVAIWAFTGWGQPFPQGLLWPIFPFAGWASAWSRTGTSSITPTSTPRGSSSVR